MAKVYDKYRRIFQSHGVHGIGHVKEKKGGSLRLLEEPKEFM